MSIRFLYGDILGDSTDTYVAHQCNCVSTDSKGLAKALFDAYPYANVYNTRQKPSQPGTIVVSGDPDRGQRLIVNMMAQLCPGKPMTASDQASHRKNWFTQCLQAISDYARIHTDLKRSIAFPWMVGCGLAGGMWATYSRMLYNFAHQCEFNVTVYRLPIEGVTPGDGLQVVLMGGSRIWNKPNVIESRLSKLQSGTVVVCSSYDGADAMIRREATRLSKSKKFEVVQCPYAWKKYGKGLSKNVNPIKVWSPSAIILFHHKASYSPGCKIMIAQAHKMGIPVYVDDGKSI